MSKENKTLWGISIIESDTMLKGTAIFGPLPTEEDLKEHGSFEKYIEARKKSFAMITGLDDGALSADETG